MLRFYDAAIVDGGLHVMGDVDDFCDILVGRRGDGLPDFFYEVFSMESPLPSCKEAMLAVHTVLGLDLTR